MNMSGENSFFLYYIYKLASTVVKNFTNLELIAYLRHLLLSIL